MARASGTRSFIWAVICTRCAASSAYDGELRGTGAMAAAAAVERVVSEWLGQQEAVVGSDHSARA